MNGGRWEQPRGRPPWWPRNEPFPPRSGEWPTVRRRFMRRVVTFVLLALVLLVTIVSLTTALALRVLEHAGPVGALVVGLFLLAGFAMVFTAAGRGVRRYASPLADLIEATGRVADGDLTARVQERGPRAMRGVARAFNTMSARLAASEEQRRRLLADVGHELRTPLTVVQGNLEALIDGVRPADAEHLRAILDETRVVSRLVEDLGTLSVAEAGALPLHREPTDLGALARETANSYASQAASAGVRIVAEANDAALVDADPVRIREVLANLVANAIRYTPADGLVRIVVGREPTAVRVSVSDTGVGIPAEAIDHIFERFYKSPQSRGAGLGLAIAKQLVQAHGGTIAATSVPGQGTEIRFTIPVGSS